ncbi:transmembrane protease serine 4a isoform X2 [Oryzias melastigma]|uniref:Transmembrane protease serine 4-like n=1 Tax=Oryzias melastigma TaxID=30732 RepID=A0A3B3DLK1_ORYME|nr:transmembrane protease serine 4a isoform X2 [Oryzias melastigma]
MPIPNSTIDESARPLNSRRGGNMKKSTNPYVAFKDKLSKRTKTLLIILFVVAILVLFSVTGYYVSKLIKSKYFFCSRSVKFIPLGKACDKQIDCSDGEDENDCVLNFEANTTFPVRLASSQNILQVYSESSGWSSVCSNEWTQQHTETACKQLGYTKNPTSTYIQVSSLTLSLKNGKFSSVRPGPSSTPIHQATSSSSVCRSGSVVSVTCSDCGVSKSEPYSRIVGGNTTDIADYPWQVSLQVNDQHTCGGSLVSPRWIVTAAHCFNGNNQVTSRWTVMSGRSYLTTIGASYVDKILVHKKYIPQQQDYDIALIRLSSPITVGDYRRPVCLPPKDLALASQTPLFVTGWGYLTEEGSVSSTLQEAEVPLIDWSTCSKLPIYRNTLTQRMICAGYLGGEVDACKGDSGGPLVHFLSRQWTLVGVVSWGIGCARANSPGVYTNVDEMLNWIQTTIEKNS